jgi:hypothetical protein
MKPRQQIEAMLADCLEFTMEAVRLTVARSFTADEFRELLKGPEYAAADAAIETGAYIEAIMRYLDVEHERRAAFESEIRKRLGIEK